MKAYEWNRRR